MTDNFLGELRLFAFGKIPKGWLPCNGQILLIQQYQGLFGLLKNMYGGDGTVNFALPDLRGRVAVGTGQSPGGSINFQLAATGGSETVTLTAAQVPGHDHNVMASQSTDTTAASPAGNYLGVAMASGAGTPPFNLYAPIPGQATSTAWLPLAAATVSPSGGGGGHENRQPILALQICIATQGIWPSRA